MNNRALFALTVILAFTAGFMSAEMMNARTGTSGISITEITSNNTKIIPLNDRDYYPVAIQKIESAQKSIHMVMYEILWYGDPDTDNHEVSLLGRALADAAKRGVDVRVIMDDGRGYGFVNDALVEAAQNWKDYFTSKGVQVEFDWSNETTHDKLIIIDGSIVIVGSTNWSTSALEYNHEANALIESKEVASVYESYFEDLWKKYE